MVKFFATSFTIVILTLAAVKAQTTIVVSNYPPINTIPDTKSAQVQAWLKEVGDLSGAPNIPLPNPTGQPPPCAAKPLANECHWTCDGCASDDITACSAPNTWGLTFDDGPSTATPTLLNYLKTSKLSATFFLIGSNVIQYPQTVQRELAEGHHLASHTWSHHALTTLTNEQIVAEMKWTEKAVLDATGLKLKYMRPPYGDINNRVRYVLKKMGYIPVDWTGDAFDTNDWQMPTMSEATVISTFGKSLDAYAAGNKTKGFYCLEHDLNSLTVAAAQKLIPLGQAHKINIASVAVCENDAQPYQLGGTAAMPTVSGVTPVATTVASNSASSSATSSGAATAPTVAGKTSAASAAAKTAGLLTVAAAAFVGAVIA
ncbi:glycoside hydrolase/deacetylase [Dissophora ornata]|nr:chitin deacetylase [Dissophora ornata]KAI8595667.1 glycoside hydrolase/deacetylase [Dissophora ornata]